MNLKFSKGLYWHFCRVVPKGVDPLPVFLELCHRYTEPHRYYHNILHVENCLDAYLNLIKNDGATSPACVMAILWHDAIYDPLAEPLENESASANLLLSALGESEETLEARWMILKTADYAKQGSFGIVGDCDLLGLASARPQYIHNARLIRKEYSAYSDEQFVAGRSAFLDKMLGLQRIFVWQNMGYEDRRARENMRFELEYIQKGRPL